MSNRAFLIFFFLLATFLAVGKYYIDYMSPTGRNLVGQPKQSETQNRNQGKSSSGVLQVRG